MRRPQEDSLRVYKARHWNDHVTVSGAASGACVTAVRAWATSAGRRSFVGAAYLAARWLGDPSAVCYGGRGE